MGSGRCLSGREEAVGQGGERERDGDVGWSLEAAEVAQGDSPRAPADAVSVGNDAGAKVAAAESLVPHEAHVACSGALLGP